MGPIYLTFLFFPRPSDAGRQLNSVYWFFPRFSEQLNVNSLQLSLLKLNFQQQLAYDHEVHFPDSYHRNGDLNRNFSNQRLMVASFTKSSIHVFCCFRRSMPRFELVQINYTNFLFLHDERKSILNHCTISINLCTQIHIRDMYFSYCTTSTLFVVEKLNYKGGKFQM